LLRLCISDQHIVRNHNPSKDAAVGERQRGILLLQTKNLRPTGQHVTPPAALNKNAGNGLRIIFTLGRPGQVEISKCLDTIGVYVV